MFDPKIIREEFMGLVGLRQTDNPSFSKLSDALLYTGDNQLLNHPLINAENIELLAKDFSSYDYPVWDDVTEFVTGDRVLESSIVYEATSDNVDSQPSTSPLSWKVINLVSLYLEDIFASSAESLITDMFNMKRDVERTKTLISSMRFYEGAGNLNDKIFNNGRLVGVMLELKHSQNLVAIVERIGTQFTVADDAIPIYIYHSSQPKPIQTIEFNQTVAGGFQWTNPASKIKLHSLNQQYDAGGFFFIMYDQNNMGGGMAINKRMNFDVACQSCSTYNYNTFQRISKYLAVRACSVDPTVRVQDGELDINGIDMWNIEKTRFDYDVNYGLNFDFTVRCDITDFIVRQKDVFGDALRDKIFVNLLEVMVNSTRQNRIENTVGQMANNALASSKLGGGGAREKSEYTIKNIDFEISHLDSVCMPCRNDTGIKIKSFGLQTRGNNLTGV